MRCLVTAVNLLSRQSFVVGLQVDVMHAPILFALSASIAFFMVAGVIRHAGLQRVERVQCNSRDKFVQARACQTMISVPLVRRIWLKGR